jgi:aryl-alcohol dehydrogenase-like predicted oxidoreductase
MHLAGPAVFGWPKDRDEAIIVLRTAVELSIRHIVPAGFHGPYVANELIREAPCRRKPDDLHIVTKVGAGPTRTAAGRSAYARRAAPAGPREPRAPRLDVGRSPNMLRM